MFVSHDFDYFWRHWSAPRYEAGPEQLDRLAGRYGEPGAMVASINYYRAGAGTVHVRREWSDRLGDFFSAFEFRVAEEAGHFTPLECPAMFADAVRDVL